MNALGVYIFAGGFTQGLKKHLNVLAHLEDKPYPGTDTSLANHPEVPIHFRYDAPTWAELDDYAGKVNLVYANPPCAIVSPIGRSMLNGAGSWRTDARLSCWQRSYDAISVEPDILLIESVPGISSPRKARPFIDALARDAMSKGYSVTYMMHDGGLFGLPQHRKRFFFIAHRYILRHPEVVKRQVPPIKEVLRPVEDPGFYRPLTRDQAYVYRRLKPATVKNKYGGYYPKWERFKTAWCRLRDQPLTGPTTRKGRPLFMHSRLHEDRPCNAFVGNYWFHPTEPRPLGHNEMKALCGYPLDYKLVCRPGKAATMLAQAVLPPVGDWVGRMVMMTLDAGFKINRPALHWTDLVLRKKTDWRPVTHEIELGEVYDRDKEPDLLHEYEEA